MNPNHLPPDLPPVPDTPLAAAARALLASAAPLPLRNHCHRTYLFGAALLRDQRRSFDAEALYVAAQLHDLGLLQAWDDGVTGFEHAGAEAAVALLHQQGREDIAELVRDAITLHLQVATLDDPRPEVAGVILGSAADVTGLNLTQLPEALVAAMLERHPRAGLKEYLAAAITEQVRAKPDSAIADLVARRRFVDLVAAAPFDS